MTAPIRLAYGAHRSADQGACVMEVVSMLAKQPWTDAPTCTNAVITRAAQTVNDQLGESERQRLVALIPRIMRARRTDSDRRVNVRLAIWCARSVLHLVRDQDREVCERAIDAAQAWLDGTGSASSSADAADAASADAASAYADAAYAAASASADAAYADAASAYAASAYADAAYAAASASAYAASAYAAYADAAYAAASASAASASADAAYAADLVGWLDELLDVWEKAVNEEGEALWVPTEWEDEALAYLAEVGEEASS